MQNLQIEVGYGKDLADYNLSEKFFVRFSPLSRDPYLPFTEARMTAQQISAQLGHSLTLCLSGGLDSEAMALAFLAAEVPFDVTTLRFHDGLNAHDIERASEFCSFYKVKQNFVDLDIVSFFAKNEFLDYVDTNFCPSPEVAAQLWFVEKIKRPFVWGGEAFRMFVKAGHPSLQAISEVEAIMYRFVKNKKFKAVPNFHFYNPELAWSFLKTSIEYKNTLFENDRCTEFYHEKVSFYRECGFPLLDNGKRKQKLHGFEGVKIHVDGQLSTLEPKSNYNEHYRIPANRKYPFHGKTYLDIQAGDHFAKNILNIAADRGAG